MDTPKIKTLELTRQIRDRNSQHLEGKSRQERLEYYREQSVKMEIAVSQLLKEAGFSGVESRSNQRD